jgi:phage terminase small subunit
MLAVMNDPEADLTRRDRMATAAAPYVHGRSPEAQPGKKETAQIVAQTAHQDSDWSGLVN